MHVSTQNKFDLQIPVQQNIFSDKPISNYRYQNYTLYYNIENTKHNKPFIYNLPK